MGLIIMPVGLIYAGDTDLDTRVHQPIQSVGLSVAVMLHIETQCEGNGSVLVKHSNAEMEYHSSARRVGLSASMALLHPLRR